MMMMTTRMIMIMMLIPLMKLMLVLLVLVLGLLQATFETQELGAISELLPGVGMYSNTEVSSK